MHDVLKEASTSVKLRIVLDASVKTTLGVLLNDVGPSLCCLPCSIINCFQTYRIGTSDNISEMFWEGLESLFTARSGILVPMDPQPTDGILPFTPGHFLVGGPLTSLPADPDASTSKSFGKRWRYIINITNNVWKTWKLKYSHFNQELLCQVEVT